MKHAEKQGGRRRGTPVARLTVVGGCEDEAGELMRRKKTSRVVPFARSAKCKLDGRMIVVRTRGRTDAFKRQVVLSPGPVSIAKPVPTLP
jgi:hypothetical protein